MASMNSRLSVKQISSNNSPVGSVLVSDGTGSATWSVNNDMTQFLELVLAALGHDIKYDDFVKMDDNERKSILRDIKIKNVLC